MSRMRLVLLHAVEWVLLVPRFTPTLRYEWQFRQRFPHHITRYGLPIRWVGTSQGTGNRMVLYVKASGDFRQVEEVLDAFGVDGKKVSVRGIRRAEVFVNMGRKDMPRMVHAINEHLLNPFSPNFLKTGRAVNKNAGGKRKVRPNRDMVVHVEGCLILTNLPTFGGTVSYRLKVYWIASTKGYPCKMELEMVTKDGCYVPARHAKRAVKWMGFLILGLCQAAGVSTLLLHLNCKHPQFGQYAYLRNRGRAVDDRAVFDAALMASMHPACPDGTVPRDTLVGGLCVALGRPLSGKKAWTRLTGFGAFVRPSRAYRYAPRHNKAAVMAAIRGPWKDGEPRQPVADAAGLARFQDRVVAGLVAVRTRNPVPVPAV